MNHGLRSIPGLFSPNPPYHRSTTKIVQDPSHGCNNFLAVRLVSVGLFLLLSLPTAADANLDWHQRAE